MNQNAISNLKPEDINALEKLRARLMPLAYNLHELQNEIARSPDGMLKWPTIQRSQSLLNSHLSAVRELIRGGEDPKFELLSRLFPYPMPPFPVEQMEGLASTLTRKKFEPGDEKWILERLSKAGEFCDGVEELGLDVGARKEGKEEDEDMKMKDDDEVDDDDEAGDGGDDSKKPGAGIKRVKTNLSQADITYLWTQAPEWSGAILQKIIGVEDSESGSEASSPASGSEDKKVEEDKKKKKGAPAGAVDTPAMPLGSILKFMETGEGSGT